MVEWACPHGPDTRVTSPAFEVVPFSSPTLREGREASESEFRGEGLVRARAIFLASALPEGSYLAFDPPTGHWSLRKCFLEGLIGEVFEFFKGNVIFCKELGHREQDEVAR